MAPAADPNGADTGDQEPRHVRSRQRLGGGRRHASGPERRARDPYSFNEYRPLGHAMDLGGFAAAMHNAERDLISPPLDDARSVLNLSKAASERAAGLGRPKLAGRRSRQALLPLIPVAWGALSMAGVYPWAYWPLAAISV